MEEQPERVSSPSEWHGAEGEARAVWLRPGVVCVWLTGEIDLLNCDGMGRWLESLPADTMQLDLTGVRFLAVCGARRLAHLRAELQARSGTLRVLPPPEPVIRRVLDATGPFEIFEPVVESSG
ncbi:STAS domain-containing protein [Pseudonocardia benzenivorans]|uniref:STAS domain-containing protein n=1 Tax=Pseudonocardia benzenivorans TaxID=228005 RepID=A0ABW3VL65_9PSEU